MTGHCAEHHLAHSEADLLQLTVSSRLHVTSVSPDYPKVQMAAAGVQDSAADHACSHLGKAVAIATILRGTGHHAQRYDLDWRCKGVIYMPSLLATKSVVSCRVASVELEALLLQAHGLLC